MMAGAQKILVLGATGQVGHELLTALSPLSEVVAATRSGALIDGSTCLRADLADAGSLRAALDATTPDLVVNAAAYTAVDRAEDEPDLADRINHRAVAEIGDWAAGRGAAVVHFSTDYVFDGRGTRPYREDDPTAPIGVYGRSKLAGEEALAASGAEHLIFRTAWIYAARGSNFLRTMLRLAAERDALRVVADQVGTPTPARFIARATAAAIAARSAAGAGGRREMQGIYHLVAEGLASWFEFAEAIVAGAHARGLLNRMPRMQAIATAEYPTRAARPAYSVLDTGKLRATFGLQCPHWRGGLEEVLDELAAPAMSTGRSPSE